MAKGNEPAYPCTKLEDVEKVFTRSDGREIRNIAREDVSYSGMSIRLKIASDAMCAILSNVHNTGYTSNELVIKEALEVTDLLLKLEEETRTEI